MIELNENKNEKRETLEILEEKFEKENSPDKNKNIFWDAEGKLIKPIYDENYTVN